MDSALRHQFNDISAACQVLQRRCGSERDMEYLEIIQRAVLRAVRVLQNRELAFRLEDEDELRAVFATVDLADWCREVTAQAAELLEAGGITLTFRCEWASLLTMADAALLERMLYELISNAAKAMSGGGRLSVSLVKTGTAAVITVGDEGEGLSEAAVERLFGEGSGEPDLSPEAGAGLGLRLARTVAEIHGGLMMLDTAPGRGVRAAVSIPLREDHRVRLRSPEASMDARERALVALSDVLPEAAFDLR